LHKFCCLRGFTMHRAPSSSSSGTACRYCFLCAGLPLQQTAEGEKPLTRRTFALYTETRECAFTRCSGGHRFVLDTDTLADLTFLVRDIVTVYWVKRADQWPTQELPQMTVG
jgi:hypothetical protein